MKKLTEEDVFLYHEHLISKTSCIYCKGMEWDDCLMAANEGFLYAIRSYRKEVSDFASYARQCIYKHIKKEKKEYNRVRRMDSRLPLDKPVTTGENAESIGTVFFQDQSDFTNAVMLRVFLDTLEREEKIIAYMYMQEYTSEEIMERRNISKDKLEYCKKVIRELWLQYDSVTSGLDILLYGQAR